MGRRGFGAGAAVVVAAAVALALAGCGSEADLATLPFGDGSSGASVASTEEGGAGPNFEYRLAVELPPDEQRAAAYELGDAAERDRVETLARSLGLRSGAVTSAEGWSVVDGGRALVVRRAPGAPWTYGTHGAACLGPDAPVSSDGSAACGPPPGAALGGAASPGTADPSEGEVACEMPPCPMGRFCAQVCSSSGTPAAGDPLALPEAPPADEPVPAADRPSRDEAERVARDLLGRTGVDLAGAAVRADDWTDAWYVTVSPRAEGRPTVGFEASATVGPGDEVTAASGFLAEPEELGRYPLVGGSAALGRLRTGHGVRFDRTGPVPARDVACPADQDCAVRPIPSAVVGVRLGLALQPASTPGPAALLVPAYLFDVDGGTTVAVAAVADEHLQRSPTPEPVAEPEPASEEEAACVVAVSEGDEPPSGAEPRPPGPRAPENRPMTVEVCVSPASPEPGEEVSFAVRTSDPDAPILAGGDCGGPTASFGDESAAASTCVPGCASPEGQPTPPPEPGLVELAYRHRYERPGTYAARFRFASGSVCSHPYADATEVVVPVTIRR